MKCPHCQTSIKPSQSETHFASNSDGLWWARECECPACEKTIVELIHRVHQGPGFRTLSETVVYPRSASRPPAPAEVDDLLRELYDEASLVANDSPRAAGALLRRALQQLIRDTIGIKKRDLNSEIDELLQSGQLPGYIADIVDSVRAVGNFAAHPVKSTNTGDVIDVEPGEVELCFDVLESLFDFYFVQPAHVAAKKAAINQKLQEANKPPLK